MHIRAVCALVILGTSAARAQSGVRLEGGLLEETSGPGLMVGVPLGSTPVSLEGAIGRSVGGGVSFAWPSFNPRFGPHALMFLSAGVSMWIRARQPGIERGEGTVVAGVRIPYSDEGGPVFETGVGAFRTFGGATVTGYTAGLSLRLALGWQF